MLAANGWPGLPTFAQGLACEAELLKPRQGLDGVAKLARWSLWPIDASRLRIDGISFVF